MQKGGILQISIFLSRFLLSHVYHNGIHTPIEKQLQTDVIHRESLTIITNENIPSIFNHRFDVIEPLQIYHRTGIDKRGYGWRNIPYGITGTRYKVRIIR